MHASLTTVAAALLFSVTLPAQKLDLNLDHLIPLAKEHTVVDLDGPQIRAALAAAPEETRKFEAQAKQVESLQVRTFKFHNEGAYQQSDVEAIRRQLDTPGWNRIVSVREPKESVDVYLKMNGPEAGGIAVIAAEPKELTVVHIVGALGLKDLQALVSSKIAYDLSTAGK
ncbi:MAG: DUF4252 domain-containing protein [Bryobacterales bacterium]|nr:DUF4252 domain-containing protein [Bryobacterales bacterium]